MQKIQDCLKKKYNITSIFPLTELEQNNNKIYLFRGNDGKVMSTLYTDGSLDHLDTWIDKKPWERDSFFKDCFGVKRFEFLVSDASFLLIEKINNYQRESVLYTDLTSLDTITINKIYSVSINDKENLKIKRLEL